MFLQNWKYIQHCWIQSFLVTLAQPPCCSTILAAHLQKTNVKTSQEDLKRLRWHLGVYGIFSQTVLTVKYRKSQTPHFSGEIQTSGYSAVTVFCLYFLSFLVSGFLCVLLSALLIQSLIFFLYTSQWYFFSNFDIPMTYLNLLFPVNAHKASQKNINRKT